jgi:general transcription factor 3C polypeptide 5 (transcription factor C subunit 1)
MTKLRDEVLTGDVSKMRSFKFDLSRKPEVNEELIPPPSLTDHPLPFNWGYHQNPNVRLEFNDVTGEHVLVNHSKPVKVQALVIAHSAGSVPQDSPFQPPDEPILKMFLAELQKAMDERPIWTRRALINRLGQAPGAYLMKQALQYIGYQFRKGPFRDAIIRYGVDPRTDPKYRIYQTLFFKIYDERHKEPGQAWCDNRSKYTKKPDHENINAKTHIFDGKSVSLDGKIWQVCDITDPLLARLLASETLREKFDTVSDGWYCNGSWAKLPSKFQTTSRPKPR